MCPLLIFGLTLLVCTQAQAADRYALLIGVSKYDHAEMNKPEPLKFPEEDAKALGELLKKGGYEVEVLLGKDATRDGIEKKLAGLRRKGTSEGVVVVGLFGHGVEIETRENSNKVVMEGCFCPYDTELRIAKDGQGRNLTGENGRPLIEPDPTSLIKLSDLMISLGVAKAGNRVVLADCCRTVPNQARGRSFGAGFRAQDLPDNTSVLFGCSPNEKAFEHADWGHGAFTKCLLEAMAELAANGGVDTANLAGLLKKRVPELVKTVSPRDHQTPKLFTTDLVDLQLAPLSFSKSPPSSTTKPTIEREPTESNNTATSRAFEGTKAGDRKEIASGIHFRWCPAGVFKMGDPKFELWRTTDENEVLVALSSGYWLAETEVTQDQWKRVMLSKPWSGQAYVKEGANCAASYISHDDAAEFCKKLTRQERGAKRLPYGWTYSLPTEAQWEYACRAGTITRFSFGETQFRLGEFGWWGGISGDGNAKVEKYAHEVGEKEPNSWGLFDMHGNVNEWCSDWNSIKLAGGRDPKGPKAGTFRVIRGGNWSLSAIQCSSQFRDSSSPDHRGCCSGFRIAVLPE